MGNNLLNILEVASPCTASWDDMEGGEVVRFCAQCQLNVYNLSAMPAEAAEAFLEERRSQARTCVRFFRRHDGTIITRDCPVGLAAVRAKLQRAVAGTFTVAASLLVLLFAGLGRIHASSGASPVSLVQRWLFPGAPPRRAIAGEMVLPPRPAPNTTACPPSTLPPGN